jgi:hypothetical protein
MGWDIIVLPLVPFGVNGWPPLIIKRSFEHLSGEIGKFSLVEGIAFRKASRERCVNKSKFIYLDAQGNQAQLVAKPMAASPSGTARSGNAQRGGSHHAAAPTRARSNGCQEANRGLPSPVSSRTSSPAAAPTVDRRATVLLPA